MSSSTSRDEIRLFGAPPEGVECHPRPAAYAVIRNENGRVAVVRSSATGESLCWLPGGGMEPGEAPEETIHREIREELGCGARILGRLGEAVQFFYAGDLGCWFRMTAVFFQVEFAGEPTHVGEHQLEWLELRTDVRQFFHECHKSAAGLR